LCTTVLLLQMWYGTYSALVAPATPVGKSRLVDEFVASVGGESQLATGRCLAYGHGITYWPVVEAIRDGIGIAENDPPAVAATRLRATLASEPDAVRIAEIIGGLLGIADAVPGSDEMFWAIRKTFEAMARVRPLILVFDDIHWGEPTFLDLVEHVAPATVGAAAARAARLALGDRTVLLAHHGPDVTHFAHDATSSSYRGLHRTQLS